MAELWACIRRGGSLDEVKRLIDNRQDVNYRNVNDGNGTILHSFFRYYGEKAGVESFNILKLLLEKGAEVDAGDVANWTPLMLLVLKGFPVDHLGLLMSEGAHVNKKDLFGRSALHIVGLMDEKNRGGNSIKLLKLLLEKGAVIDCVDGDGFTPLMYLMDGGFSLDHLEILLKNGANVKQKNKEGITVLHKFTKGYYNKIGEDSLKILKSFVRYGCDVDAVNEYGNTPLKLLLEKKFPAEFLEVLLCESTDVNRRYKYGNTLLHRFVEIYSEEFNDKSLGILNVLIQYGVDIHCANVAGQTCIKLMVKKHFPIEHIKVVLDRGADVLSPSRNSPNVLHNMLWGYISRPWSENLFQLLLDYGADPNEMDKKGTPILFSCVVRNEKGYARKLCEYGAKIEWDSEQGRQIFQNYRDNRNTEIDLIYEIVFKYELLQNDKFIDKFSDNYVGDASKLRLFVNSCKKELTEMRGNQIYDQATFYDFMSETNRRRLGGRFRRWGLGAAAEAALEAGFPIYADVIRSRLSTARRSAETQEKLEPISSMSAVNGSGVRVELNRDCVQQVASFLNDYQLQKFITASLMT